MIKTDEVRPQRDDQDNGFERNRLLREKLNVHSRKSVLVNKASGVTPSPERILELSSTKLEKTQ